MIWDDWRDEACDLAHMLEKDGFDSPYIGENMSTATRKIINYIKWLKGENDDD